MRVSIEICSGGSGIGGRSRARSSTRRNAASRLKRSTSSSGSYRLAGERLDPRVGPRPLRAAQRLAIVQQLGRRLEPLVLEQPPDQRIARVDLLVLDAGRRSGRGSSIRLLMWMSVAAMTRNSLATSRLSSCIRFEVLRGTAR